MTSTNASAPQVWPPGRDGAPETDRLWIFHAPLKFYGIPFGARMTVARLADGSLWVHSPIALTPPVRAALDRLGPVGHVVTPNKLHHLFLIPFQAAYPQAQFHAPPGLADKRPDVRFDGTLDDAIDNALAPPWGDGIDLVTVRGSRVMEEVVFYHRASRTLILGDLLENFSRDDPWLTRVAARIGGMYGRPGMPRDWRLTFRDKAAARQSISRILNWPFDSIVLAHGRPVPRDGNAVFRLAFSWLMD
jgi:hypothetical protein